jgi:hypothetical protein
VSEGDAEEDAEVYGVDVPEVEFYLVWWLLGCADEYATSSQASRICCKFGL